MTEKTLQDWVDAAAILSAEHQAHLADLHGEDAWNAELTEGTLTFTSGDGRRTTCRAQFLGTSAPGPGTWLWGWHNVNGFPDHLLAAANAVRDSGGVPELTTAELPLTDELPYRLVVAAKAVASSWTHYSAPVGSGTRAWFLIEHPTFALGPASVVRLARAIVDGISSTTVADHARAVRWYAEQRGIALDSDAHGLRLVASDGTVTVELDGPRAARVSVSTGGTVAAVAAEAVAAPPADAPQGDRRRSWFGRRS